MYTILDLNNMLLWLSNKQGPNFYVLLWGDHNKPWVYFSCSALTHWGRDKLAAIFQMTFSNMIICLVFFFLNENVWISIKISLKFVPKDAIENIPALVQIMAWRRPGDKLLSEPMMVISLMHICITPPQCDNLISSGSHLKSQEFHINLGNNDQAT